MKRFIIFAFVAVIAAGALFFLNSKKGDIKLPAITPEVKTPTVTINSNKISVRLAKTSAEKAKGLSGTKNLGDNEGMLFEFNPKTKPSFWMKDMLIPLDIIWIADGKIIGIEKDVPFPEVHTPDARLPLYYPNGLIDYVLEVNAGFCNKNGIKEGDSVIFNLQS